MAERACARCGAKKPADAFSARQWRKGLRARCADCGAGRRAARPERPTERLNHSSGAEFRRHDLRHPFASGGFRWVARGVYTDGPRAGEACVAKWSKAGYATSAADFRGDLRCAAKAVELVRQFNADRIITTHIRVNVPEVREFGPRTGLAGVKYMQEPFIEHYDKWNSNSGWATLATPWARAMQALSHYSYHRSGGHYVLCDVQGGSSGSSAVLSDPAILSWSGSYGVTDMGPAGIANFFALHTCTEYCSRRWIRPGSPAYTIPAERGTTVVGRATTRVARTTRTTATTAGSAGTRGTRDTRGRRETARYDAPAHSPPRERERFYYEEDGQYYYYYTDDPHGLNQAPAAEEASSDEDDGGEEEVSEEAPSGEEASSEEEASADEYDTSGYDGNDASSEDEEVEGDEADFEGFDEYGTGYDDGYYLGDEEYV